MNHEKSYMKIVMQDHLRKAKIYEKKWKALRKRDKRVTSIINSITDNE